MEETESPNHHVEDCIKQEHLLWTSWEQELNRYYIKATEIWWFV